MKTYKNFYKKDDQSAEYVKMTDNIERDENGFVHIAITTDIFAEVKKTLLPTNSMYNNLLNDIRPSIEPYSPNEKIILDTYVTNEIDELTTETVNYGFKKYVSACMLGLKQQHKSRFFLFLSFLIVGVLIELLLYGYLDGVKSFPFWLFKSFEVLANLFIWQFGGYVAFEFLGERKKVKRYKQIANLKFNIKKWD